MGPHIYSEKQYIPQVDFNSLDSLSQDELTKIKRRGTVLIRDVVDDAQAVKWKDDLKEFIKVNDKRGVEGIFQFDQDIRLFFFLITMQTRFSSQRQAVFPTLVRSIVFVLFKRINLQH